MGWPRKDDEMRLYQDKDESYILALTCNGLGHGGSYEAIANAYTGSSPSLCGTSVGLSYITKNWLKRTQWDELPEEWQEAFYKYMTQGDEFNPFEVRGLWRVESYRPFCYCVMLPGNITPVVIGRAKTPTEARRLASKHGYDRPFYNVEKADPTQYYHWIREKLHTEIA